MALYGDGSHADGCCQATDTLSISKVKVITHPLVDKA